MHETFISLIQMQATAMERLTEIANNQATALEMMSKRLLILEGRVNKCEEDIIFSSVGMRRI